MFARTGLLHAFLLAATAIFTAAAGPAVCAGLEIPFTLSRPAGDGPFPAVVILHDCSGLGPRSSGAPGRWTTRLTAMGYVTIRPDSFSTRGHPDGVCIDGSPPIIGPLQRAGDAYAALAHLRTLPFVDPRRVAVMGGSHGGRSTLATIVDSRSNSANREDGFAAAIALYPNCSGPFGDWSVIRDRAAGSPILGYRGTFRPLAPLLILIGELDDWTPAEQCRQLAAKAKAEGHPVELVVYPDAHHSFDSAAPLVFNPRRRNANAPGGLGATTAGNAAAWADAVVQVEKFFARTLAGNGRKSP
ncbi:MAG: dienelactone hydrolase family protein [Proteobacteria bacterium]|nr:dienelactone hydrolase family protein [Pseudomonadota bacterium]